MKQKLDVALIHFEMEYYLFTGQVTVCFFVCLSRVYFCFHMFLHLCIPVNIMGQSIPSTHMHLPNMDSNSHKFHNGLGVQM